MLKLVWLPFYELLIMSDIGVTLNAKNKLQNSTDIKKNHVYLKHCIYKMLLFTTNDTKSVFKMR